LTEILETKDGGLLLKAKLKVNLKKEGLV